MRRSQFFTSVLLAAVLAVLAAGIVGAAQLGFGERSLDGSGNNISEPAWGVGPGFYARLDYGASHPLGNAYEDGVDDAARSGGPNSRAVSNALSQGGHIEEPMGFNEMLAWWMFHIHVDIAVGQQTPDHPGQPNIEVPAGDPAFAPGSEIAFRRSFSSQEVLPPALQPPAREILNVKSAWLDADMIYQASPVEAAAMRTFTDGMLVTQSIASGEEILPSVAYVQATNPTGPMPFPHLGGGLGFVFPTTQAPFAGGAAIDTMLLREHNRVASSITALSKGQRNGLGLPERDDDPAAYDEAVFQLSRKIVEAEIQAITYEEMLPSMGVELDDYAGYDPTVFPAVFVEFASGPMRLHTMLNALMPRVGSNGAPSGAPIDNTSFFAVPYAVWSQGGMDDVIRGMLVTPAQKNDLILDESLRSVSPQLPLGGVGDLNDLMATHIERGRDRGLPAFDTLRLALGLSPITSFADITSDTAVQAELSALYGTVDDIDPLVGLLAEDRVPGSLFGETTVALYQLQFSVIRDSDRFFYQNVLAEDPKVRKAMRKIGLDIDDDEGPWVLRRSLGGLIADTTSIGAQGDVVSIDASSAAFMTQ